MANLNLGKTKIISDKNNTFFTNNKIMTGTKIPTTGEYVKGDMIVNIGPSSSTEPIWICNVSGSPGVWSVLGIGTVGGGGSETTIVSADVVCIQDIVTVNSAVTEVSLEGLGVAITPNDKLLVHFNSVYLMEGVDYNIDYSSNKITVIGDVPWNESSIENSVFSLELFTNVEDTDGAVIQARFENNQNIVRLQESTNEIEIGIDGFDKNNNLLLVFKNTLHIAEGKDYSISDDSSKIVNLSPDDWAWNAGDEFVFIILRVVPNIDMPAGSISGGSLVEGSITIDKLGEDVQEAIRNAAESGGTNGGGSRLVKFENNVILENDSNNVEIGIERFDKSLDTLLVFKNALHLIEDVDFSINGDGTITNISPDNWSWEAGDEFSFIVFKSVSEVDGDLIETKIEFINASLIILENVVNVNSSVSEVEIGIEGFDKDKDTIMAYVNSVHMSEGVDYSISDDSSKIVAIGENWNSENMEGFEFAFVVFKNVADSSTPNSLSGNTIKDGTISLDKLGEDVQEAIRNAAESGGTNGGGSSKLVRVQNVVNVNSSVSEVEIGIEGFNKNSDVLMVFKNSTHIAENVEYNINDDSSKIVKMDGEWNTSNVEGYEFVFIVFKNVIGTDVENSVSGSVIQNGSITIDKLGEDVQEAIRNAAESGGSGSKLASVQNTVVLDMNASEIEIGITGFNKSTDTLLVFKNSVHMAEGIEYNINDNNIVINKIEGEWLSGDSFVFLAFSNMMSEEDLNEIDLSGYQPINDDTLMTENKTVSGAINEVFVVASSNSVDENEIRRIINEEIESLKKEIEALKSTQNR